MTWAQAFTEVAMALIVFTAVCKMWTGDWPWQGRE